MSKPDEMNVLSLVRSALADRRRPSQAFDSVELTTDERAAVNAIFKLNWPEVTLRDWEEHQDAISFFAPEAFCYYLPSLIVTSVIEHRSHIAAVATVLFALDRTPDESLWDEHFSQRWTLLNEHELNAVAAWIDWLSSVGGAVIDDLGLIRALMNLDLLTRRLIH